MKRGIVIRRNGNTNSVTMDGVTHDLSVADNKTMKAFLAMLKAPYKAS